MRASRCAPLVLALSLVLGSCTAQPTDAASSAKRPDLGLMSTLPLYWGEASGVGELLKDSPGEGAGWVRPALEERFDLVPLDVLSDETLSPLRHLILAQPRALSAAENVALDAWVRRGGRLLLFADPMLTRHSRYAMGDRRRPQDVVLLSPILAHWGLTLRFDEDQREGERIETAGGVAMPLYLAGDFIAGPGGACRLADNPVLAQCRLGEGRVVALADAALLDDPDEGDGAVRRRALGQLVALTFD